MKKKSHKELVNWEKKYPTGRRGGYAEFSDDIAAKRSDYYAEFLDGKIGRLPTTDEIIAAFGKLPPEELSQAYDLDDDDLDGRLEFVQRKYILRFKNIRRSWALLLQYMPEIMSDARKLKVLEMSTAHGATLEILKNFGHTVTGNDYPNFVSGKRGVDSRTRKVNEYDLSEFEADHDLGDADGTADLDWIYRPITESAGLKVDLFDAGALPYPYKDNSFDFVCCFDALEHYCHPSDWMQIIHEFTRISKESVLVITNPVQGHMVDNDKYMEAFYAFQQEMQTYHHNKFRCISAGIERNQLTAYKLMEFSK